MAQTRQNMGSGNVKKLLLQLMIPAVVAQVVNILFRCIEFADGLCYTGFVRFGI